MPICGENQKKVIDRISRIEGQVRALRKMVENDANCIDFLGQVSAAAGALRSLGTVVLEEHLKGCVSAAFRSGADEEELVRELVEIFGKFSR